MGAARRRCAGWSLAGVVYAMAAFGCMPLIWRVNYFPIRGAVGRPLNVTPRAQCDDPRLLSEAIVEEGDFPPGLTLRPDGALAGVPTTAGRWHAMIRLARLQCGDQIYPDERVGLNFEIGVPKQ